MRTIVRLFITKTLLIVIVSSYSNNNNIFAFKLFLFCFVSLLHYSNEVSSRWVQGVKKKSTGRIKGQNVLNLY